MTGTDRHDDERCRGALEVLYDYLDGALTVERRTVIRAHIDGCGSCLQAYEFHLELRRLVADGCREEVPRGLVDRVLRALEEAGRHQGPGAVPPPRSP